MSENTKKKGMGTGTGLVVGIAVIYILLGLAMLLIPRFQAVYIIYAAGIILLIFGVILIVRYFLSESYLDLGKYGFSGGVLCLIIGICMLIRASAVAKDFPLFLGICILFTAVVKLQNAVALKSMGKSMWAVFLIIAIAFAAASLIIILDLFRINGKYPLYIYIILVADGAVNLAETLFLALAIRRNAKSANAVILPAETEEQETAAVTEEEQQDILLPFGEDEQKEEQP